ncbi:hypothetical protein M2451_000747 [Dysgonomonas sp. PFB1-18]|uniref:hypothetical protein n=1 Tax=unclassified Dysgonomonas TaxID=2630389 RepID=UPI002476BEDB|nr:MULTISPECIES: hypothetical protein [unclassified Dysgonomonas]MDH6308436.1 hypothetical protein [Dysgonomonas sp. PF1-14]MDH6337937.1 hypothetical protein [Dysgonomonas sp. PF1-16]MDH6379434.1 hypothetical protein [Dysgonomonas sp. PFB1-18]MDH6396765.1 hypothetical protein [Dysgonomonas sp. PF1-23]
MKWWISKYKIYPVLILILLPIIASAQNGYERRVEKYQNQWSKLIPTHTKIQYAGGMGLLSFGAGWDYGKNNQWETDVFLGFLPKYSTSKTKITFTLKQNFIPWNKKLGKNFSLDPLACGLYINTIFDGDFWVSEPDKYPNDYYSFSTKMRFNIYVGQRITYKIPEDKRFFAKSITAFYELSTNDLYMASAFTNKYLKPDDYLRLSFGLKFQLF